MKQFVILTIATAAAGTLFALPAFAQTPTPSNCPPLYNGGVICEEAKDFRIDKKVQTPKDGSYVDQIPQNETLIAPDHTMIFRIVVTNKTDKRITNLSVKDTLPDFISFVDADRDIKQNGDIVSYTIKAIEPSKSDTMNLQVKVASNSEFSQSNEPVCVANQVEATSGFLSKQTAKDYATFCVSPNGQSAPAPTNVPNTPSSGQTDTTKGGQPIAAPTANPNKTKGGQTVFPQPNTSQNPNTGPEALALIGLIPAGLGGFLLRRIKK